MVTGQVTDDYQMVVLVLLDPDAVGLPGGLEPNRPRKLPRIWFLLVDLEHGVVAAPVALEFAHPQVVLSRLAGPWCQRHAEDRRDPLQKRRRPRRASRGSLCMFRSRSMTDSERFKT